MSDLKALLIFLSQFDLTNSKMQQIVDFLGEKASIKAFTNAKLVQNNILKEENYQKMLVMADIEFVKTYMINLAERGIYAVCIEDEEYPQKLRYLDDAPLLLYYMGDISLANKPALTVVGTRKPTSYGKMVTEKLIRDVAGAGVVIVSGLAYGVDSISHRTCLENNGKTIAVLGSGFEHIYPTEHQGLANQIAQKGLLLSEYRPKKTASKYTFPLRNRIIAGLGDGVLITEASLKSGTIHTRDYALDYGKYLYAVPGNIDNQGSALPNEMLKSGHAKLVTCSRDILDEYQLNVEENKLDFSTYSKEEQEILAQLADGMKSQEDITKNITFDIKTFNSYLTTLEISGIIRRMPGGYISLN